MGSPAEQESDINNICEEENLMKATGESTDAISHHKTIQLM